MADFQALVAAGRNFEQYVSDGLPAEIAAVRGYQQKISAGTLPAWQQQALADLNGGFTLLVAAEMWCPDCQRNVTAMQLLSQLRPEIRLAIISKGRAEKGLKVPLGLTTIPVPTVAVLNEQLELIGQFIERPQRVINGDAATLEAYKRGELLAEVTGDLLQIMQG